MNCTNGEEKINAYLDGELDFEDREGLEAHLAGCADCRQLLDSMRAQDRDLLDAFEGSRRRHRAAAERAVAALHRDPRSRPSAAWFTLPLAAAAGFLAAFLLRQDPRVSELDGRLRDLQAQFQRERARLEKELAESRKKDPPRLPAARLAVATGAVEVCRENTDWTPLATGGGIEPGTRVRTMGRAKCSFLSTDGSELRLNANTEVCYVGPRRIELARGQISTVVAPSKERFAVRTDQAEIEALGTTLDISHLVRSSESNEKVKKEGQRVTTLLVVEGQARMGNRIVPAGFQCRTVDGQSGEPDRVHELTLLTKWVHEILRLKGHDSEELERRVNEMLAMLGRTKMEELYEYEIRAMGERCVLPLLRFIQSPQSRSDPKRRRDAARILADIAGPSVVPDFVRLLSDSDGEVRVHIARGLRRLTGESLQMDDNYWKRDPGWTNGCDRWENWLDRHRDTWGGPQRDRK